MVNNSGNLMLPLMNFWNRSFFIGTIFKKFAANINNNLDVVIKINKKIKKHLNNYYISY
jgi:hypothetical protein